MLNADLNLNLLATLDLLLTEGSVSRTASRLGVSQAAVSTQLAKLRAHFEDDLFVIRGRRLVRTPFAESLAAPLDEMMSRARDICRLRQEFRPETAERAFQIQAGDIDTFLLLARLVCRLKGIAPNVSISIRSFASDLREVDLSVVPWGLHDQSMPSQELYKDEYCVLADASHPRLQTGIDSDTYFGLRHVVRHSGATGRLSLEALTMSRMGYNRQVGAIVDAYASIPFFLSGTDYLSTVPRRFAQEMTKIHAVKWLPLPFTFPSQTVIVQWNEHSHNDMALLWLRNQLVDVAREIY